MEKHQSHPQGPGFSALVDDVLYLVCSELYETSYASLLALAQISPSANAIATPYIFQNLLLSPGSEGSQKRRAYELLLQRLHGQAGSKLLKRVRHVRVDGYESVASLEAILEKCENVHTFSWHSHTEMHDRFLRILQRTSPGVRIMIRRHSRGYVETSEARSDRALLSCPQLVALEYKVVSDREVASGLEQLLSFLQIGAHCKSLRIDLTQIERRGDANHPNLVHAALPSLEDLAVISKEFNQQSYNPFSVIYFLMKSQNLKRLELPLWTYSFPSYHDNYRNLRYLRVSTALSDQHDIASLCSLLESDEIELYGLFIEDATTQFCLKKTDELWPAVQKQGRSLRELMVPMSHRNGSKHYYQRYLDMDDLAEISEEFPVLERLGLDIPLAPEGVASDNDNPLDDAYISHLTKMNLKALDIHIFLPPDRKTTFTPKQAKGEPLLPEIDVDGTLDVIYSIADRIFDAQGRPLQTLTAHMSTEGTKPKEAKIQLRIKDRDDSASLGREKYREIKRCEWRDFDAWDPDDLRVFDMDRED